jgi:hypothetical protein
MDFKFVFLFMYIYVYPNVQKRYYLFLNYDNCGICEAGGRVRVFGPCPSFGILENTKEHSVSETGSLFILMSDVGDAYSVGFIRKS